MVRKLLLGAAMIMALAAPARAQDQCVTPKAPVIPDGARATSNQIIAAQNEIKAYVAASDNYQSCLAQEIAREKAIRTQDNVGGIDPGVQSPLQVKSAAQRNDAQQVAAAWGAAVDAFNKAQQRKQRQPASTASPVGGGYGGAMGAGRY